MSIRTILVPFTENCDTPAAKTALAAARHLQAHLVGVYVEAVRQSVPMPPPRATVDPRAGAFGMSTMRGELATLDPLAETTRQRDQAAQSAKAGFEMLCRQWQVPFLDGDAAGQGDRPLPSASFRRQIGDLPHVVGQQGHTCDMVVTESASVSKETKAARSAIDNVLLNSGRPVLLAPSNPPEHLNGRIMVAWNDSPQCWHALGAALPFLAKAKDILLFHVGQDRAGRSAEEKAADYLAWHGIEAEVVQQEPGPSGVAEYLMSQCGERQVALMVMGAYSHSPLRERLLGGVTFKVLSNVAATPVLMVH